MARKNDRNLVVGLDIGTSKVVAIVGELTPDGLIEVVGLGSHPSRGVGGATFSPCAKAATAADVANNASAVKGAFTCSSHVAGCGVRSRASSCHDT